jgi:hypothetical protein
MPSASPILLLEINEISWRMLRHYLDQKKYHNLNAFFETAKHYTSITVDEGELSPWVVWPSIHRGMPNTEHRIFNLGQDPATFKGTPIWEEFLCRGKDIGVFGSLQSWPPKAPGKNGFYITDTFAHDSRCYPEFLQPILEFNLRQVAKSGRSVADTSVFSGVNIIFLLALLKARVKLKTLFALAFQLLGEKMDPRLKARRSIYQGVLFWDIFCGLFDPRNPPAFSTFFTNHVAGMMHRFWNHVFPEDFPTHMRPTEPYHKSTVDFSMSVLDEMLADVLRWQKINPTLTVIFATGMGQDKVIREEHHGFELTVSDTTKLMQSFGLNHTQFKALLAMAPQCAVEIEDSELRKSLIGRLNAAKTMSGKNLFLLKEEGKSLSITILYEDRNDCLAGKFSLQPGKECSFFDAGIKSWEIEAGTAYHIPEGIFAISGPGALLFEKLQKDPNIPADKIKEKLMQIGGIA